MEIIVGDPQGNRMGVVPILRGGCEDYMMTVRFPYDLRKVSVRTGPVCHQKKLLGDRQDCKDIRLSLEHAPTMPEKSYRKS